MRLNDGLGDCQPQSRATVSLAGRVCAIEAVKDALEIFNFESRSAILYCQFDLAVRMGVFRREDDSSTFRRMAQGIVQDIREDLRHSSRICFDEGKGRSNVEFKADILSLRLVL